LLSEGKIKNKIIGQISSKEYIYMRTIRRALNEKIGNKKLIDAKNLQEFY
jgi:hypothetical protein